MATGTKHVVIVQGHPDPQRRHICHALADAYAARAREAGHEVVTVDVARLDFPLARRREALESGPTPEAIRQVQDALTRANHVVVFYPVWNGATPALLKGFLEQTFRSSFVFLDAKPHERLGFSSYSSRKALPGKSGRVVATIDAGICVSLVLSPTSGEEHPAAHWYQSDSREPDRARGGARWTQT
jgi:putative NADPH-quinone reductase